MALRAFFGKILGRFFAYLSREIPKARRNRNREDRYVDKPKQNDVQPAAD